MAIFLMKELLVRVSAGIFASIHRDTPDRVGSMAVAG
jgi:hypothetical protein